MPIVKLDKERVFLEVDGDYLSIKVAEDILLSQFKHGKNIDLFNFTRDIMIDGELITYLSFLSIEPYLRYELAKFNCNCSFDNFFAIFISRIRLISHFNVSSFKDIEHRNSIFHSTNEEGEEIALEDSLFCLGRTDNIIKFFK